MSTAAAMRASAANLRLLASIYEANAIAEQNFSAAAAWDEAMSHILDAQTALDVAADALDGIWILPLPRRAA